MAVRAQFENSNEYVSLSEISVRLCGDALRLWWGRGRAETLKMEYVSEALFDAAFHQTRLLEA